MSVLRLDEWTRQELLCRRSDLRTAIVRAQARGQQTDLLVAARQTLQTIESLLATDRAKRQPGGYR